MPPKQTVKRKAGKDGEGEPSALKAKPSDDLIDEDGKTEGISGLVEEILHKIYAELDVVSRVNLSQTCKRLYEIEKRAPAAKYPQTWSHLAIRTTMVEVDSDQRKTRRLGNLTSQSKMVVEIELRNGNCEPHNSEPPECTVRAHGMKIQQFVTRDDEAVYWKTSLDQTPVLLSSIFMSTAVTNVCAQVDLSDPNQKWFEMLRQFECENMCIQHVKAVCEYRRDAGWKEIDEPGVLSPSLFTPSAFFFEGAKRLTLIDVRMERSDYPAFYQKLKTTSMKVCWYFTKARCTLAELKIFAYEIMGVDQGKSPLLNHNVKSTHQHNPVHYISRSGLLMVDGVRQIYIKKSGIVLIKSDDILGRLPRYHSRRTRRLPYMAQTDD